MSGPADQCYDLLVIGGGINGAGIARDAAGRGLAVALCERDDLACATSSASSKLIHGGLRYLEQYQFRLVAEALAERETLLDIAPHIVAPLTFVLPWVPQMRPRWMLRAGMWLYDRIGGRSRLSGSRSLDLAASPLGAGLRPGLERGFAYSDCRTDDARLTVLNCRSAADLGATILTRTRITGARCVDGIWQVEAQHAGETRQLRARALVNAAGPWVRAVLERLVEQPGSHRVRLVKGSHIVTRRLYPGEHAYILQNRDRRVVLVIPFLDRFTLIGTTDVPHPSEAEPPLASADEIAYLCDAVNGYLAERVRPADVLWSFSGVRPLYDDGHTNPSEVTRDYKLLLDAQAGAPLLSIYGGKITTYRKLAEHALEKLARWFPGMGAPWTAQRPLPGGDIAGGDMAALRVRLRSEYPGLPATLLDALAQRHGTLAREVLGGAATEADLGEHFGALLYQREVDYFVEREWAHSAEDILWRRTKTGLTLGSEGASALARYLARRAA